MSNEKARIISASRRTDIPALYSEWFMNRIRAGWCQVPNPLNYNQLSYISLRTEDVDAIVFWSKYPKPMLKYLSELDDRGFRYYFQFAVNDYPGILEPGIPNINKRLEVFRQISKHVAPLRIIWRYDPIVISNRTPPDFHRDKFTSIANALKGHTKRVMVSLVDYYKKTDRRLSELEGEGEGYQFDRQATHSPEIWDLLEDLSSIAKDNEMEIFTCAEERDFSGAGIYPGRCVDGELLSRLWALHGHTKKDPTQRDACLCVASKDIGINDTCIHGCPYCYSTHNIELAKRRYSEHNPESPVIWGKARPLTEAEKAEQRQSRLL